MRWNKRRIPAMHSLAGMRSLISRSTTNLFLLIFLIPGALFQSPIRQSNAESASRLVEVEVEIMTTHWQLAEWASGGNVCDIFLKHDKFPSSSEIWASCGYAVLEDWVKTPPCTDALTGGSTAACDGLFLRYIAQAPVKYIEQVQLPGISFQINSINCTPGEWCPTRPLITIDATEPLAGYQIDKVYVRVGGREKSYTGESGRFNLPLTDAQGNWLEYWAESSYGDRSELIRIKYRCVMAEDGSAFHFDLLGDEWESSAASGSVLWQLFPPVDGSLPSILEQAQSVDDLYTSHSYLYLAGYLIQSGVINASSCLDGGLYASGSASPCGERVGVEQIIAWQNQYDAQILQAALKYNVPAQLLKGIIAQESQFWPTSYDPYEQGLGYITSDGVDMLMMWNLPYYLDTCVPLFSEDICSPGYSNLSDIRQDMLRKFVLDKVGTPEEIDVLAATLLASATQTGQLVENVARQEPAYVTTYTDMWKITAGNYYSGAGCIGDAMTKVVENDEDVSWDTISGQFPQECELATTYVDRVMANSAGTSTP